MNAEFLSTGQVQRQLNIDRTTVYRMLKDGRLSGVKIGRQWRFPSQQIAALMAGSHHTQTGTPTYSNNFPGIELQSLQDVIAETISLGLHAISPTGEQLTALSNSCRFCQLIQSTTSGNRACKEAWARLAEKPPGKKFTACHAGLTYARVPIQREGVHEGFLIAGQFYSKRPDSEGQANRIKILAKKHKINRRKLVEAAADITILPASQRSKIWDWMEKIAASFAMFSQKQRALSQRLQQIAQMCDLNL